MNAVVYPVTFSNSRRDDGLSTLGNGRFHKLTILFGLLQVISNKDKLALGEGVHAAQVLMAIKISWGGCRGGRRKSRLDFPA
jgi:hypothetical protein